MHMAVTSDVFETFDRFMSQWWSSDAIEELIEDSECAPLIDDVDIIKDASQKRQYLQGYRSSLWHYRRMLDIHCPLTPSWINSSERQFMIDAKKETIAEFRGSHPIDVSSGFIFIHYILLKGLVAHYILLRLLYIISFYRHSSL
jgi:hypothetical protein